MFLQDKKPGLYSKQGRSDPNITDQRKNKSKDQAKSRRDREKKEFDNLFFALPIDSKPNEKNTNLQLSLGFLLCRKLYERPRRKALLKWYKNRKGEKNNTDMKVRASIISQETINWSLSQLLLAETSLFSTLVKMTLNGLVIHIILSGESAGRIIHVSENSHKYIGIEPRNLVGRFIFDLFHVVDIQLLLRTLEVPFQLTLDNEVEDWKVEDDSDSIKPFVGQRDGVLKELDNFVKIDADILANSDTSRSKGTGPDQNQEGCEESNSNKSTNTSSSSLHRKAGCPSRNDRIYQSYLSNEFDKDIDEISSFSGVLFRCHQKASEKQVRCEINEQLFKSIYMTDSWQKLKITRAENSLITGVSDQMANQDYFIQLSPFYCGNYRVMKFSGKKVYSNSTKEKFCFGFLEDASSNVSYPNSFKISQIPIQSHEALAIILECDLYFSAKKVRCSKNCKKLRLSKFRIPKGLPNLKNELFMQMLIEDIEELNRVKDDVLRTGYGESRYPLKFDFDEEDTYQVRAYLRENKSATKINQNQSNTSKDFSLVTNTDDFHRLAQNSKNLIFDIILVLEIAYISEVNQKISDKFISGLAYDNEVEFKDVDAETLIVPQVSVKISNEPSLPLSQTTSKSVVLRENQKNQKPHHDIVSSQEVNIQSSLTMDIPSMVKPKLQNIDSKTTRSKSEGFEYRDLRHIFQDRDPREEQSKWVLNNWIDQSAEHLQNDRSNEVLTRTEVLDSSNRERITKHWNSGESISDNIKIFKQQPLDFKIQNLAENTSETSAINYATTDLINHEVTQQFNKLMDSINHVELSIKGETHTKMLQDLNKIKTILIKERQRIDDEAAIAMVSNYEYFKDMYNWPLLSDRTFFHLDTVSENELKNESVVASKPVKNTITVKRRKIRVPLPKEQTKIIKKSVIHSKKYNTIYNRTQRFINNRAIRSRSFKSKKAFRKPPKILIHSSKTKTHYNRTLRRNNRIDRTKGKKEMIGEHFITTYKNIVNKHRSPLPNNNEFGSLHPDTQDVPANITLEKAYRDYKERDIRKRLTNMNLTTLRRTLRLFKFLADWGFFYSSNDAFPEVLPNNGQDQNNCNNNNNNAQENEKQSFFRDILNDPEISPTSLINLKYLDKENLVEISTWSTEYQQLFLKNLTKWEGFIGIQRTNYTIKQIVIAAALSKLNNEKQSNSTTSKLNESIGEPDKFINKKAKNLNHTRAEIRKKCTLIGQSYQMISLNDTKRKRKISESTTSSAKRRRSSKSSHVREIKQFLKDQGSIPKIIHSNFSTSEKTDTKSNSTMTRTTSKMSSNNYYAPIKIPPLKKQRADYLSRKHNIIRSLIKNQQLPDQIENESETKSNISNGSNIESTNVSNTSDSNTDESIVSVIMSILKDLPNVNKVSTEKKRSNLPIVRENLRNAIGPISEVESVIAGSVFDQLDSMDDIITWIEKKNLTHKNFMEMDSHQRKNLGDMLGRYCTMQARLRVKTKLVEEANSQWLDKGRNQNKVFFGDH